MSDVVVITEDARPEYRYGALMAHMGRRPTGWIPAEQITTRQVDELIAEANDLAAEGGRWVGVVGVHAASETVPSDAIIDAPIA